MDNIICQEIFLFSFTIMRTRKPAIQTIKFLSLTIYYISIFMPIRFCRVGLLFLSLQADDPDETKRLHSKTPSKMILLFMVYSMCTEKAKKRYNLDEKSSIWQLPLFSYSGKLIRLNFHKRFFFPEVFTTNITSAIANDAKMVSLLITIR